MLARRGRLEKFFWRRKVESSNYFLASGVWFNPGGMDELRLAGHVGVVVSHGWNVEEKETGLCSEVMVEFGCGGE